ncbi:MAG: hypothetical protein RLZZ511_4163 [Cyanobacteriota bacterium]|jgi:hypothetical protein
MGLQEELDSKRKDIRTDSYSMSIGELINLYENQEIEIHPEFQRFFRWSQTQKTKFIESLLIGLPIPQVFVSQREDGIWDVVDGLQRLSTIYELAGILRDEDGNTREPLVLEGADYLPSLKNKKWEDEATPENSLTQGQRLLIKRAKIDVAILKQESDVTAKYELFQRLNTGGSIATDQEIRNCLLIMSNRDLYAWLRDLSQHEAFQLCISLSDKARQEQYDMELLLRFIIFRSMSTEALSKIPYPDISEFITRRLIDFSTEQNLDRAVEETAFTRTFGVLAEQLQENSFRKYDHQRERFMGGFLISAFEAVALGLGFHHEHLAARKIDVCQRVKSLWSDVRFTSSLGGTAGGNIKTRKRIQNILPVGREIFEV